MNDSKPAVGGYKHATRFNVRNHVYHAVNGSKGVVTAVCIRDNGATTYEVTWDDRSSEWAAEFELSAEPVEKFTGQAGAEA